jgi:hypothetical protein
MKLRLLRWLLVVIGLYAAPGQPADGLIAAKGTRVENLSATIRKAGSWLGPSPDFEVVGRVAWLLGGDNTLVDLGSGKRILPKGFVVHAFARTAEGTVAVITENVLGIITRGVFLPTTRLPFGNMRVAAGPRETFLLFGGPENDQHLISYDGERHATLLRVSDPIAVVTHVADRIFLAAGNKLYTVRPGEPPALMFLFPDGSEIVGLTVNARSGEIFVSTADAVFALDRGVAEKKLAGLGGRLQWRDGRLYVLDPVQSVFARVSFVGNGN